MQEQRKALKEISNLDAQFQKSGVLMDRNAKGDSSDDEALQQEAALNASKDEFESDTDESDEDDIVMSESDLGIVSQRIPINEELVDKNPFELWSTFKPFLEEQGYNLSFKCPVRSGHSVKFYNTEDKHLKSEAMMCNYCQKKGQRMKFGFYMCTKCKGDQCTKVCWECLLFSKYPANIPVMDQFKGLQNVLLSGSNLQINTETSQRWVCASECIEKQKHPHFPDHLFKCESKLTRDLSDELYTDEELHNIIQYEARDSHFKICLPCLLKWQIALKDV